MEFKNFLKNEEQLDEATEGSIWSYIKDTYIMLNMTSKYGKVVKKHKDDSLEDKAQGIITFIGDVKSKITNQSIYAAFAKSFEQALAADKKFGTELKAKIISAL